MPKFFKSNHADVYRAWESYQHQVDKMKDEHYAFADYFDAEPVFALSFMGHAFAGLVLNHAKTRADAEFWTKPEPSNGNISHLRSRVKGKESMSKLRDLKTKYAELEPKLSKVSLDELYASIGTNWGDFVFSGLNLFAVNGVVYIYTSVEPRKNVEEITESDFKAAKQAKNELDKAA